MDEIIDASFKPDEIIIQNPDQPCPEVLLNSLGLIEVRYISFDRKYHKGQIVVSTSVMPEIEAFFRQALEIGFPIERVVPVSAPQYRWDGKKVIADNVTSGFDYRLIKTTGKPSSHSKGLAFDVNPRQNPYIRYEKGKRVLKVPHSQAVYDPTKAGVLHGEHPLVKLMEGFGWEWGGRWEPESGRVDYMHFQKNG